MAFADLGMIFYDFATLLTWFGDDLGMTWMDFGMIWR